MRINFNELLIDARDKEPLVGERVGKDGSRKWENMSLGYVAGEALSHPFPDEKIDYKEKLRRGRLIDTICGDGKSYLDGELDLEEVSLIRTLVGKAYPQLVIVAVEKLLDPRPNA